MVVLVFDPSCASLGKLHGNFYMRNRLVWLSPAILVLVNHEVTTKTIGRVLKLLGITSDEAIVNVVENLYIEVFKKRNTPLVFVSNDLALCQRLRQVGVVTFTPRLNPKYLKLTNYRLLRKLKRLIIVDKVLNDLHYVICKCFKFSKAKPLTPDTVNYVVNYMTEAKTFRFVKIVFKDCVYTFDTWKLSASKHVLENIDEHGHIHCTLTKLGYREALEEALKTLEETVKTS